MTEPTPADVASAAPTDCAWQAALATWRQAGVPAHDPVRWHYLETLVGRAQPAPPAVQERLWAQVQAVVSADAVWSRPAPATPAAPAVRPPPQMQLQRVSPLAGLTRQLLQRQRGADDPSQARDGADAPAPEMHSLQRFREVWAKVSAEDQLARALARGPDNAGPLNSHRLVLRTLTLMRELSPDYLRHFLAHLDTLLWLEQAQAQAQPKTAPGVTKPARRRR